MAKQPWPKLSEDLDGPKHPERCQACGQAWDVEAWQEHDQADARTPVVVVLCLKCSDKLIEKHPRLYRRLENFEPFPGVMTLCIDCRNRRGVACSHPDLTSNGGAGLAITSPRPGRMFIDGTTKGGKRIGFSVLNYPGRATACAGREVIAIELASRLCE